MLVVGQVTVQPTILLQLLKVEEIVQIVAHISHIGGLAFSLLHAVCGGQITISLSQMKGREAGGSWQVRQLF